MNTDNGVVKAWEGWVWGEGGRCANIHTKKGHHNTVDNKDIFLKINVSNNNKKRINIVPDPRKAMILPNRLYNRDKKKIKKNLIRARTE